MFYTYKNINIYYETIGVGNPVLMIHGLGCDLTLLKKCMEPIFKKHENYKRIYIDLPGMGKSDALKEYSSSDKILEILLSFIKEVINSKFLLIGQSYGGYLARGILSKCSDMVDGMLLICPVVISDVKKRNVPEVKIKYRDEIFLKELHDSEKNDFLEDCIVANSEVFYRYKNEIQSGLKIANNVFIDYLKDDYCFSFDVDKEVCKLNYEKSVLFIAGRQDNCVGYQDLWNLIEDYKSASFSLINYAGHNLQIEQTQIFNALVNNWLFSLENYQN